jgi:hypothetical protein
MNGEYKGDAAMTYIKGTYLVGFKKFANNMTRLTEENTEIGVGCFAASSTHSDKC